MTRLLQSYISVWKWRGEGEPRGLVGVFAVGLLRYCFSEPSSLNPRDLWSLFCCWRRLCWLLCIRCQLHSTWLPAELVIGREGALCSRLVSSWQIPCEPPVQLGGPVLRVLAALGSWLIETGHGTLRGSRACVQWVAGFAFSVTERCPERPIVHGRTRLFPDRLYTQPSFLGLGAHSSPPCLCSRLCDKPGC